VIPVRFDAASFRGSSFSNSASAGLKTVDFMKFILLLHILYALALEIAGQKKFSNVCSFDFLEKNFCDVFIILLQGFVLSMKLRDQDAMNIDDPAMFLQKQNLERFYRLCFFCRNLRS